MSLDSSESFRALHLILELLDFLAPELSSRRGRMRPLSYRETLPPPVLAHFVDRFWSSDAPDRLRTNRILPDGCVDLVVHCGDTPRVELVGTMTRAVLVTPRAAFAAIRFRPGVARTVLGVDASELTDRNVPLADLGRLGLPTALFAGARKEEVLRSLRTWLERRVGGIEHPDTRIAFAVRRLLAWDAPSTAELAREIGWTRQALRRAFLREVGANPKDIARIFRVQRALTLFSDARLPATQVALDAGFFDQAHMIGDFRRLTGLTPSSAEIGSIFPIRSLFEGVRPGP